MPKEPIRDKNGRIIGYYDRPYTEAEVAISTAIVRGIGEAGGKALASPHASTVVVLLFVGTVAIVLGIALIFGFEAVFGRPELSRQFEQLPTRMTPGSQARGIGASEGHITIDNDIPSIKGISIWILVDVTEPIADNPRYSPGDAGGSLCTFEKQGDKYVPVSTHWFNIGRPGPCVFSRVIPSGQILGSVVRCTMFAEHVYTSNQGSSIWWEERSCFPTSGLFVVEDKGRGNPFR